MLEENKIIHGLWVSGVLTPMQQLTLRSFTHLGHEFHLWTYGSDKVSDLPSRVVVEDAACIVPKEKVFCYKNGMPWGSGSYGGFSDVFRYKLLYEKGGWWVDMDVTCLKPFDFPEPYFFRNHWQLQVVGNVMKAPRGSALMKRCYQRAAQEVTADNKDWNKPIIILNEEIARLGLMHYRRLGLFNEDLAHMIKPYFEMNHAIPADWYGIHWINSAAEVRAKTGSAYDLLLKKYGIIQPKSFKLW